MSDRPVWATPQLWWRTVIVIAGMAGLLLGNPQIAYYTTQSNLITAGYFACCLYAMVRRGSTEPAAPRVRGAITLCIMITCLVAHFLLNHGANPLPGLVVADLAEATTNRGIFLLHYVVPLMVLADWLAFGPHRVSPWRDLPLWLILPLGYGFTSIARAVLAPTVPYRYPYFFLDPTTHGYGWVALQMVQLAVEFAVLGALLLALDRLVARVTTGSEPAPVSAGAEPGQVRRPG